MTTSLPRTFLWCSAFWLALTSCADVSAPQSGPVLDTLPNGVIHVQNSESGAWRPGEGWTLRETLRLGTVLGEGPDLFGYVQDLEVDVMGRLWVYDAQAEEIRVFNSDGEYVRAIGRAGEGPGEFGNVYALEWDPGNRLWVVDRGLGRISVFDTAGTFLTSRRRGNPYFAYPWPGRIDRKGFFYDLQSVSGPDRNVFLVCYDSLLRAVDTIGLPEHPDGPAEIRVPVSGGMATYQRPYAGTAEWSLTADGGMWVAITDQYRLLRLTRGGDTVRVVTKPFEPIPVTGEERSQVLEGYRDVGADLSRFEVPESKPAIADLFVDDRDYAWVIPELAGDQTGTVAEVFDSVGVFLGRVELPLRLPVHPVLIRHRTLTTVTTDTLGVPFVVQFTIEGRGAG